MRIQMLYMHVKSVRTFSRAHLALLLAPHRQIPHSLARNNRDGAGAQQSTHTYTLDPIANAFAPTRLAQSIVRESYAQQSVVGVSRRVGTFPEHPLP